MTGVSHVISAPRLFTLFAAALLAVSLGPALHSAQAQNVFTVDATSDASDANAGNGTCDDGNGNCTLRAAIEEANATSNSGGADVIEFDIGSASPSGPHVIQPQSALPDIMDPVEIDGTSAQSYSGTPVVEIDGASAGSGANGFNVVDGGGGGLIAKGLSVINFDSDGFQLRDGSNRVKGCHVGVRADGTTEAGNGRGLFVDISDTVVGGSASPDGNVISGNEFAGMSIRTFGTVTSPFVQGNQIGVDASGSPMGNGEEGITLNGSAAVVGGIGSGEGNVIAHNGNAGVRVQESNSSPHVQNQIRGNRIFANSGIGIDLGSEGAVTPGPLEGPTANDEGDGDDGPNRLQNFPEIQSADYDSGADEVSVTYQVPSDPNESGDGASDYDLTIDFYRADTDEEEGEAYLGTDTYTTSDYNTSTSGPDPKTVTFTPAASVTENDDVVATATDADGNTSEFGSESQQLPVEIAGFEGTATDKDIRLTWQTASEQNNAGFEVQRKEESGWEQMGYVDSKAPGGSTAETKSYQYTATGLSVGTHQFRLKQVDLDGSAEVHGPISARVQMQDALKLTAPAPNPVSSTATLSFAVKEKAQARVAVYDLLGRKARTLFEGSPTPEESKQLQLDASSLPSGPYMIRLQADGQTRTQRMTVVQ